jgi:hypothetical protein
MSRAVRTSVLAAAAAAALLAGWPAPVVAGAAAADGAAVLHGSLLAEQENRNGVQVQHLDGLDGSQVRLPFVAAGAADVSPDGTRIAYVGVARDSAGVRRDAVLVRSTAGATVVLAFLLADGVRWSGDGGYVVASTEDGATGALSLWRLSAGHAPVRLLARPRDQSGYSFDVDPHSNLVTYVSNQDVFGVDALTRATSRLTHQCSTASECTGAYAFEDVDWSPTGNRILVRFRQTDPTDLTSHDHLGWLTPGQEDPVAVRDFADNEYANSPLVSPDGQLIAWQIEGGVVSVPDTDVMAADGGPVTRLRLAHLAWQSCPGGACPVFAAAPATRTAPARVGIGRAYAGAAGGRTTARVTWRAPRSSGSSAVTSYRVDATRLSAANRVLGHVGATKGRSARAATLALPPGRYRFRVRAVSAVGPGPWSVGANLVRSR